MDIKIKPCRTWKTAYESGRSCLLKGLPGQAIDAFKKAAMLNPSSAEVHHDLGVAWHQMGHYASAFACFEKAVNLNDSLAQAWFNGANSLCQMKRFNDAVYWFQQSIKVEPGFVDAHYNLANTIKRLEHYPEALFHYREALKLNPAHYEAHNNMGTIFLKTGQLDQAVPCFYKALESHPCFSKAFYNLSLCFERLGRLQDAIAHAQRALRLQPEYGEAVVLMVSLLQQACDWDALDKFVNRMVQVSQKKLNSGHRALEPPFLCFTISADPKRNFQVACSWSKWLENRENAHHTPISLSKQRASPDRPLVIGYLSEQFRNAATAHLMAGLFANHDRNMCQIIAYSWGRDDGSTYRLKIEQDVDRFVDIRSLTVDHAAARISKDRVDILVDLMGWMRGHRMDILLRRPAPVQVNYLGYPGTTGASFMDYIIADRGVIPLEEQRYYTEKVVYMPYCYQVTDPDPPIDTNPIERNDCGLPEKVMVFCSFSTDYKIEPQVFRIWMRILSRVPDSVLWLLVRAPEARMNLCREAASQGVDPRRLVFAEPLPKHKHLARLKLADLALDTLTVNGHTTASDALWAGVPLITCKGTHFASRVAASILRAIGLPELVTDCIDEYERLIFRLAGSPKQLQSLRKKLSEHKSTYPLFDVKRFARHLESAYQRMWQRFIKGLPAESFEVNSHHP